MRLKGLLFDKDGTLIDFNHTWLPVYRRAAEHLAARSQHGITAEQLLLSGGYLPQSNSWQADSLLASGSNQQILAHWLQLTGLQIDAELLQGLNQILSTGQQDLQAVAPDTQAFLRGLKVQGYKIGVATMDDEAHARHTLNSLGVSDELDFICGADSGFGVKPEPGMLQAFCQTCSLNASEVAVIGDSPRDLQMGQNAGAGVTIGVLSGASARQALQAHTSYILPDINGLPELLNEMRAG